MGQDHIEQHRRYIVISYAFMFLALFTVIFAAFAYLVARKVAVVMTRKFDSCSCAMDYAQWYSIPPSCQFLLWSGLFSLSFLHGIATFG